MRALLVVLALVLAGCPAKKPKPVGAPETVPEPRRVEGGSIIDDASHLNATRVDDVTRPAAHQAVLDALKRAAAAGKPVSMAGARHSQGGHAFDEGAIVLDMRALNQIHEVDPLKKTARVDSGVTWAQLQEAINDKGLAVRTQQSSNIFTLGGSMSSNIHGRDPAASLLSTSVLGFRLARPDGSVARVSREENPELFRMVQGGYGLFGVILDVDLQLTDNELLEKRAKLLDYKAFPAFFDEVLSKPETALFIARPSVAPSSLLKETVVTWWARVPGEVEGELVTLGQEINVKRDKAVFDASRNSDAGKEIRWRLQRQLIARPGKVERVSRNNAMRPPTAPLKFLEHKSDTDADIVQEYFVPKAGFVAFMDGAREILRTRKVNLMGLTIRFVDEDREIFLPYSRAPSFSFMLYTNQRTDPAGVQAAREMTHDLVELALSLKGRHYLSYQTWPTREQVKRGYPELDAFCAKKRELDPGGRFSSRFYRAYCPG